MLLPPFFHRQVVVQDAERAMIIERLQQIERFKIVGAGFLRPVGADVEIAEIDEGVGDGVRVLFAALDGQHFFIAGVRLFQITGQGAGIAEVAEAVGELPLRAPMTRSSFTAASQAARAWTRSPRWRKMRARCLSFSAISFLKRDFV